MPNVPKLGPEWSQLWTIVGKLADDDRLDRTERQWLTELLQGIAANDDVRRRFRKGVSSVPDFADRDFWIACDVEQHKFDGFDGPLYLTVAERWKITRTRNGVEDPELTHDYINKIVFRQRQAESVVSIRHLLGSGFANVIEIHRDKFLGGTSRS